MKASVIISVYKNIEALRCILDSLQQQTEQDFEIIISEDGQDSAMHQFVATYPFAHPYQHLTQEDCGWNKNRALNRAVIAAQSNWLIFVDGDCVLHPQFIAAHLAMADEQCIVGGKRVKLNQSLSQTLQHKGIGAWINWHLLIRLFQHKGCRNVEEGFYIPLMKYLPRKIRHITGSNMSVSKTALLRINGFDENYIRPAVGEDYDIEWRLLSLGYKIRSVRNLAVQYHLWHKENWQEQSANMAYCKQQQAAKAFICEKGINQHITIHNV